MLRCLILLISVDRSKEINCIEVLTIPIVYICLNLVVALKIAEKETKKHSIATNKKNVVFVRVLKNMFYMAESNAEDKFGIVFRM